MQTTNIETQMHIFSYISQFYSSFYDFLYT